MPLDVQATLEARAWAMLNAYAPFTALVKEGNRYTQTRREESEREKQKTSPADFPAVWVSVAEDTTNDRSPTIFNDTPADVDYGIPMTLNLEIKITHDGTMLGTQTPVEAAVRGALLSAGRTLGLSWVSSFIIRPTSRKIENIGGTNRTIARMKLVVTARPLRSLLIAV